MREIEVEEGGATQAVSNAMLALATQLAEQLKREATAELDEVQARMDDQRAADERARAELEAQLGEARRAVNDVLRRLEACEKIARHTAEQRVLDLNDGLADVERHQESLEEKHKHARDALEHYRTAAKEQR